MGLWHIVNISRRASSSLLKTSYVFSCTRHFPDGRESEWSARNVVANKLQRGLKPERHC